MNIRLAESPDDIAAVQHLWREYWESMGLPLDFQGFAAELDGLPGVYGTEGGALLLVSFDGKAAGTIALRRLTANSGEVKRLYVCPEFRGQGIARQLLEAIFDRAHAFLYQYLYADTLPIMMEALKLYERLGFERVEPYSDCPTPGAIYLRLQLFGSSPQTDAPP